MKQLLAVLLLLAVAVPAWGHQVDAPNVNPTFRSVYFDSTGNGRVTLRAKAGSGDSLEVYFYPIDSCMALFPGGVGSTSKNFLYYVPCNSNDTIRLSDVSAAGDDTTKWLINSDTTKSFRLLGDSAIFTNVTGSHIVLKTASGDAFSALVDTVGRTNALGFVTILGSLRLMVDTATTGDVRVLYPFDTTLAGGIPNGAGPFWNTANGQFEFTVPAAGQSLGADTGNGGQASFVLPTNTVFGPDSTTQAKFEDQATDTLSFTVVKIPDNAVSGSAKIAAGAVDLTTDVTGILPVENGGTETGSHTDGGVLIGKGTAAITNTGVIPNGGLIIGDGTTDPVTAVMGGDGSITSGGSLTVNDDSHAHTNSTISGIDSTDITDKGISTADLQDTVVTGPKIDSDAIDSSKIVSKGISSADLQDTSVVAGKIDTDAVDSTEILAKGVSSADLQDTSVIAGKIDTDAVDSTEILAKGISSGDLQDTSVVAGKIDTDAVDSTEIVAKGISTADLQDTVVTGPKIKTDAVDSTKILAKGISTGDLQDTSVVGSKIDTHAVDTSKMDFTNTGTAGQVVTKAVGANGQFTWATDATGGSGASRIFVDTGDNSQVPVPMSDSLVLQGDSTIHFRYEDQLRDTANPTVVKIPDNAVTGAGKITDGVITPADVDEGTAAADGDVATRGSASSDFDWELPAGAGRLMRASSGLDGFNFTFSTTTTDSDPGAGIFRFNSASLVGVSTIFVDSITFMSVSVPTSFTLLGSGATIYLWDINNPTNACYFVMSSSTIDGSGYYKLPVTFQDSATTGMFSADDTVVFRIQPGISGTQLLLRADPVNFVVRSTTTDADPGAGQMRYDNFATQSSAANLYVDENSAAGYDVDSIVSRWSSSMIIVLQEVSGDRSTRQSWPIRKVTTDASGYNKIHLGTNLTSTGNFAEFDTITLIPMIQPEEFDSTVFYLTPQAGNKGLAPAIQYSYLTSDFTLTNGTSLQAYFGTGQDAFDLRAATAYYVEGVVFTTTGATSSALRMGWGGTATLTSINISVTGWNGVVNTTATASNETWVSQVAVTTVTAASTTAGKHMRFFGHIVCNAAGTLIPQLAYTADPTGTLLAKVGTHVRLTAIGTSSMTTIGSAK